MSSMMLSAAVMTSMAIGAGQTGGLFTVNCSPLTIQRGDPIVFPGQISPHVHVVTGGTNFQQTESNEQARNAQATTCDKLLDKSNYWQPQLYHERHDGRFELITMQGNVSFLHFSSVLLTPRARFCHRHHLRMRRLAGQA